MIYGSTKTKLDYIIELGCKRIDAAIEGVIAKYPTPKVVEIEPKEVVADSVDDVLRDMARQQEGLRSAIRNNIMAQQQEFAVGGLYGTIAHSLVGRWI